MRAHLPIPSPTVCQLRTSSVNFGLKRWGGGGGGVGVGVG